MYQRRAGPFRRETKRMRKQEPSSPPSENKVIQFWGVCANMGASFRELRGTPPGYAADCSRYDPTVDLLRWARAGQCGKASSPCRFQQAFELPPESKSFAARTRNNEWLRNGGRTQLTSSWCVSAAGLVHTSTCSVRNGGFDWICYSAADGRPPRRGATYRHSVGHA